MEDLLTYDWQTLRGPSIPSLPVLSNFSRGILNPVQLSLNDMAVPTLVDDAKRELESAKKQGVYQFEMKSDDLLEWIQFWYLQFSQHVSYLDLLLSSSPLEKRPMNNSPLFGGLPANQPNISSAEALNLAFAADLVPNLKRLCNVIVLGWFDFQKRLEQKPDVVNFSQLHCLCKWTMTLKSSIYISAKQGIWNGTAWTGLVKHMTEELVAFTMRLSGQLNQEQLFAFLTNMVADHLSLVAHTITPGGNAAARAATMDNLNAAEEAYQVLEQKQPMSDFAREYIPSASAYYEAQLPALLSQEIENIELSLDALHLKREARFALDQLKKYRL